MGILQQQNHKNGLKIEILSMQNRKSCKMSNLHFSCRMQILENVTKLIRGYNNAVTLHFSSLHSQNQISVALFKKSVKRKIKF